VERFSKTMRVLARREPISRRKARLVAAGGSPSSDSNELSDRRKSSTSASLDEQPPLTAGQVRAHRRAAARAAKRRLRVLTLILLANAVVATLAWFRFFDWVWCAIPVGVLVAWLVACRLMVKRKRKRRPRARIPAEAPHRPSPDVTDEIAKVDAPLRDEQAERDPNAWDPVEAPLPTYVSKPVARRTVSTIDLDSTGVWSSGRSASDSALAREADAADRAKSSRSNQRRATGA
jgi:hypothetical protein